MKERETFGWFIQFVSPFLLMVLKKKPWSSFQPERQMLLMAFLIFAAPFSRAFTDRDGPSSLRLDFSGG
jgi:hypothetical protein